MTVELGTVNDTTGGDYAWKKRRNCQAGWHGSSSLISEWKDSTPIGFASQAQAFSA
jgi:hypothetical protein